VHNKVYDIELVAERVQRLVPEARVEIGHGQMPEGQLENVMLRFMNREVDVLVCTTIIESGIDVRTANTMIIDQAQNFGLSDLHQLRGRVGRYHNQAYCYLMVPDDVSLSEIAAKRLKAILQYSQLGSGFKIAMRDLELRGAGNLLGAEQSGHIATIGYDLYCRMLDRAVRKMKHQPVPPEVDTQLDLGIDFQIPRKYIASQKQRLEVYRRLARLMDDRHADTIAAEIRDRFGKPPREFEQLTQAALVRSRLSRLGIVSVTRGGDHLKFRALSAPLSQRKLNLVSKSFRVLDETSLALPLRKGLERPLEQLRFLSNLLSALARKGAFNAEEQPEPAPVS
jgi:transcription-repair coupling factor (superfamily II helicase)